MISIAEANQQRQGQTFYDKKYQPGLCQIPWNTLGINQRGDMYICSSPSWIPLFVGNIIKQDVFDGLNSETAIKIRQEIKAGRYFYCNNKICSFFGAKGITGYNTVPTDVDPLPTDFEDSELRVTAIPRNLIFDFDPTCNFQCSSCRTELINHNKHPIISAVNRSIVDRIKQQIIDRVTDPVEIRWCGGEPFISESYTQLLDYIGTVNNPRIQHIIQTNGSYLQKKSETVERLLPTMKELRISFDAASADTYHSIRTNGVWSNLLNNVVWVNNLIRKKKVKTKLIADFVVQLDNYHEIPAFVKLCKELNITQINFQKMWNWGTWSQEEFDRQNIYNYNHPQYADLVEQFRLAGKRMQHG